MTMEHDQIVTMYQCLLGRLPESEEVITSQIRQCPNPIDLVHAKSELLGVERKIL